MPKSKPSKNYKLMRQISSKIRKLDASEDVQYLIIYSFLYKYCSDSLKDYLLSSIADKEITLDEAYEKIKPDLKTDAIKTFGFFINDADYFIDDVINSAFSGRFFTHHFFSAFRQNVEFEEGSNYEKYFSFIFDAVEHAVNFSKFEYVGEKHLVVKDIIYAISRLDVFEDRFPFTKVFDRICQSKPVAVDHDPDYITNLISSIVASNAESPKNVYNPFLNDGSLLINLCSEFKMPWKMTYAKSQDKITYCSSIVKLLMEYFDLDCVYSELDNPFEPFKNAEEKFDVIMSRFPPITSKNLRRINESQSYEIAKRNKKSEIKDLLSDKYNINPESFETDSELSGALESLISKMDLKNDIEIQFTGEYASLKDSEYLFLINMINSLSDDGIMVVGMSQSFLVKNSLETLRKYLTCEMNHIDAIISVPDELTRPSGLEIVVVFKKHKTTDDIVFIDMSNDYETRAAPFATPGVFRRNLILDDSTVGKVNDVYKNRLTVDKFSNVVKISQIKDDDYNLSISRYVDTFEGEFINLNDLKNQKKEFTQNIEVLNEKIEKMMDDLGIRY
ncbi:MAG: N-6 DNA methylase [Methanobrevibacter sp.]|uniref:N-6 DNA methylase n=1 Tax=Methanobrevibacter sp. TaxID=66852 RepID=UPI0025F73BDD|nr:N-6 DNA methylase [Methanobrevibacter sp.]MBQ6099309.1 N-6 DNA methylase [Methanobrevibacter sp.]